MHTTCRTSRPSGLLGRRSRTASQPLERRRRSLCSTLVPEVLFSCSHPSFFKTPDLKRELYSVGGPPGQPPRHMTLPSGNVITPAAIAVPPSFRVGLPSTLTFLPMKSSTFQPAFFALTAPVRAVMRQTSTVPAGFVTSTTISE